MTQTRSLEHGLAADCRRAAATGGRRPAPARRPGRRRPPVLPHQRRRRCGYRRLRRSRHRHALRRAVPLRPLLLLHREPETETERAAGARLGPTHGSGDPDRNLHPDQDSNSNSNPDLDLDLETERAADDVCRATSGTDRGDGGQRFAGRRRRTPRLAAVMVNSSLQGGNVEHHVEPL